MTQPGALLPPQSFASAVPKTRRATQAFCDSSLVGAVQTDWCDRWAFTLPVNVTRFRFRIVNNVNVTNTAGPGPISTTGIWMGAPNPEVAWQGDFTGAPTQVVAAVVNAIPLGGAEYVSPWVSAATFPILAHHQAAVSIGFVSTAASTSASRNGGWSATGTGSSAAAGNQALPSGGGITQFPWLTYLDVRMEYEFVGNNPIGLFFGTSVTAGYLGVAPTASTFTGPGGPSAHWPEMACNSMGHLAINGGLQSGLTSTFTTTTNLSWTRFDLTTTVPDYAVLDGMGLNDALAQESLATFQANIFTIIANLQAAGIYKIYVTTATPGPVTPFASGLTPGYPSGLLHTALSAGAISAVVLTGQPWGTASWWNASVTAGHAWQVWLELPSSGISEGPFNVTNAAGANLSLTVSTSLVNAHTVNSPVFGSAEGYRLAYNNWLRSVPMGTRCCIDMAAAVEQNSLASVTTPPWTPLGGPGIYNPYYGSPLYVHPTTIGGHGAMAQAFRSAVIGI